MNSEASGESEIQKPTNIDNIKDSVPRVLHYCWFGQAPLSHVAQRSLFSWQEFAPGCTLRRWDESNAPIDDCVFVRDAYDAGKWAFVSDYVRFWALYNFGGVYMDTGSELIKDITPLFSCSPFAAYETVSKTANPGLIACCLPHDEIALEMLDIYRNLSFVDTNDFLLSHTVNEIFSTILEQYGYRREDRRQTVGGWTILPSEYFDPFYGFGGFHRTRHTYSVHWSSASWLDPVQRTKKKVQMKLIPILGHRLGEITGRVVAEFKHNGRHGFKNLFHVSQEVIRRNKRRD